jgi:hypothetical protein
MFDALTANMRHAHKISRDDTHKDEMEVPAWLGS